MVHARQFPDLLHVPGDVLGAVVDLEAVVELRRPPSRDRIEEPVRVLHVPAHGPEEVPPSAHDLVGRGDHCTARLRRHVHERVPGRYLVERDLRCPVPGRGGASRREGAHDRARGFGDDLARGPPPASYLVRESPFHFGRRHLGQAPDAPLEVDRVQGSVHRRGRTARAGRRSGQGGTRGGRQRFQGDGHRPTTADGVGEIRRSGRDWPLSGEPRGRRTRARAPDHTVVRLKLSSRAVRPLLEASNVSLGKRRCALVR